MFQKPIDQPLHICDFYFLSIFTPIRDAARPARRSLATGIPNQEVGNESNILTNDARLRDAKKKADGLLTSHEIYDEPLQVADEMEKLCQWIEDNFPPF